MAETRFQPGPWKAHATGRARSGLPEHEIHWSEVGECVAEVVHGEANAHLIAAAPKMYAALEEMQRLVYHLMDVCDLGRTFGLDLVLLNDAPLNARAALTQARGESDA
jgi:hypothetical protein